MDLKKTLELLEAHPMTQKLREEREAEILRVRTEAADRLARTKEEAERILPQLKAIEDQARDELAAYDKARREFEEKAAHAAAAQGRERLRFEREATEAERILLANYDERIDTAISFFRDQFEALRQKKVDRDSFNGEVNAFTWTRKTTLRSNYEAIRDALAYCTRAVVELEQMRLAPSPDLARIAELKQGLPDTNEMREYSSEIPLPPTPPDAFEQIRLAERAGTIDYLIQKAHDRIDKFTQKR